MGDPYRMLFGSPIAKPPKELETCPSCKRANKPKAMILCGRCWRLLNDAQRHELLQKRLDDVQHGQK